MRASAQAPHQRRIFHTPDAMLDASSTEHIERRPHAGGTSVLASMRGADQAGGSSNPECLAERLRRPARLVTRQAEADHASPRVGRGESRQLDRVLRRMVAAAATMKPIPTPVAACASAAARISSWSTASMSASPIRVAVAGVIQTAGSSQTAP